MAEISQLIQEGASTFLRQEYLFTFIFVCIFAAVIFLTVDVGGFYTTTAFVLGATTSILSGYIGMQIAVRTNVRTAKNALTSMNDAFNIAFRGGMVLGFMLVGLALLVLIILILFYKGLMFEKTVHSYSAHEQGEMFLKMFEAIAGYGLGGSTVALFGRVGGGIFTKAADVGADLVGKVIEDMDEDSIQNPGVIADNVGDNVGDIAGMGSDLFGSFAESTCACLVISATSVELVASQAFFFPLMISALGIIVGFITSFVSTHMINVNSLEDVEKTLKAQLYVSTILMTPAIWIAAQTCLPDTFTFQVIEGSHVTPGRAFFCAALGLWSGLIIGLTTEYYTSGSHGPVQKCAKSCESGAAPNIILGLALGYRSTMIPVMCIAFTIYMSFALANMYGIALAALGMLSTLTTALTIDGYGPISDNAGGICEMSGAPKVARDRTDALDAAGNTTAAIGKGFAIGSACLVGLALFGAFVTRSHMDSVNILRPLEFGGLTIGAMLPYYFSAMTMEAVGDAANLMIHEIKRQFDADPNIKLGKAKPDYEKCIAIST
jgi:inorganic pyrophosphatase